MTLFELEDALVEFIEQNTSELRFRSNQESELTCSPHVRSGFIPRDEVGSIIPGEITVYPAIIVSASSGVQAWDHETVTVSIVIGCFDDSLDQQGYRDCLNLVQRLKDRFREVDIIRERFPVRMPLNWQSNKKYTGGGNVYPYFFAEMQLTFELPTMASQFEFDTGTPDEQVGRYNVLPIPTPHESP